MSSQISLAKLSISGDRTPPSSATPSAPVSGTTSSLFAAADSGVATRVKEYVLPDGAIYSGEMKDKVPNGHGTCLFRNGYKFEGQWQEGLPEGPGKMIYWDNKSGNQYCVEEEWVYGQRDLNIKLFKSIQSGDLEGVQKAINEGAKLTASPS